MKFLKNKQKTQILKCQKLTITKNTKFWRLKKFKLLKFTHVNQVSAS